MFWMTVSDSFGTDMTFVVDWALYNWMFNYVTVSLQSLIACAKDIAKNGPMGFFKVNEAFWPKMALVFCLVQ